MKSHVLAGLAFLASICLARADDAKFTDTLSMADLAATGLAGLSPAQRVRLDELVAQYKNGAPAAPPAAAQVPTVPQTEAVLAPLPAAKPQSTDGFFARMKIKLKPAAKAEPPLVESTIPGQFRGWGPHQVFTLANGQMWREANGGSYYSPMVENPKVQIVPASFSGHWLRFPDLDLQVRVVPLGDN